MQPSSSYNDLARKYGFAPTPESVQRLTQLIARQDADVEEISRLISKDPGLRARLLRVANPEAESESCYTIETVDEALMRNGIGCALLLAMGTPLSVALTKAFQTMVLLKLESIDPRAAVPLEGEHVLGTIGFSGKALGRVYLRMSVASARKIVSAIIGLEPKDLDDEVIKDTVGEVLNIMTGNFKSNLCDAGLDCKLTPPLVEHSTDLETPTVPGGGLERMAFRAGEITLFVDVTVNPWSD